MTNLLPVPSDCLISTINCIYVINNLLIFSFASSSSRILAPIWFWGQSFSDAAAHSGRNLDLASEVINWD